MRSRDRLAELRQMAKGARVYHETVELLEEKVPAMPASAAHADIDNIFQEVEHMRNWIHEMNGNTQLMRRLHADPTFHGNKHLQEQLDGCIARSASAALRASDALRRFEAAATARTAGGRNDARARITRWQFAATRRLYADALDAHAAALHALRAERRLLLHEQLKLTDLTLTEEERESLLDSRDLSMFVDNVSRERSAGRVARTEPGAESRWLQVAGARGDGGGAARAARGGGATRRADAAGARATGRARPVHAARAPGRRAAGARGQRGVLRAAGHGARGERSARAAEGHGVARARTEEKNKPYYLLGGGFLRGAARARAHVTCRVQPRPAPSLVCVLLLRASPAPCCPPPPCRSAHESTALSTYVSFLLYC